MSEVLLRQEQEEANTEPQRNHDMYPQGTSPEMPQSDKNEVRAFTEESSESD